MANGDMLTTDYQWQLHNTLYGAGSGNAHLEFGQSIGGLGVPDAKTQDVVWNLKSGSYANPDYLPMRVLTIPALIRSTSASAVMTSLKALQLDWIPVVADTDLAFQLPGWGKFMVNGRPRGATFDFSARSTQVAHVLLRFDCPDPTITYL